MRRLITAILIPILLLSFQVICLSGYEDCNDFATETYNKNIPDLKPKEIYIIDTTNNTISKVIISFEHIPNKILTAYDKDVLFKTLKQIFNSNISIVDVYEDFSITIWEN